MYLLSKRESNLDVGNCVKVVKLPINYKSPVAALQRERAKNAALVKQIQIEAKKAKLKSLYGTDDLGKIRPKTRRQYIKEFILNTLNDSSFIAID